MVEVGSFVMHIDTEKLGEEIDEGINITKDSINESVDKAAKVADDLVIEHYKQIIENVKTHAESEPHADHWF